MCKALYTQWGVPKDGGAEAVTYFGSYKHGLWRGVPSFRPPRAVEPLTSSLICLCFSFFTCKIIPHRLLWGWNRLTYLKALSHVWGTITPWSILNTLPEFLPLENSDKGVYIKGRLILKGKNNELDPLSHFFQGRHSVIHRSLSSPDLLQLLPTGSLRPLVSDSGLTSATENEISRQASQVLPGKWQRRAFGLCLSFTLFPVWLSGPDWTSAFVFWWTPFFTGMEVPIRVAFPSAISWLSALRRLNPATCALSLRLGSAVHR